MSSLLEIYDKEKDICFAFELDKASKLLEGAQGDKLVVKLAKMVDFHMLNALPPKRKLSGVDEEKRVKVSEYIPEG